MKELEKAVLAVMLGEAPLHPNQQKIDVVDDDKIDGKDFAKLRAMKNKKTGKIHNCAVHVEHPEYGTGLCISEAHADPDENGDIAWYTAKFESGTHVVQTKDVKILASESHMHEDTEQVEEMSKSMAYATGTKKAMQMTGDKPPLEKSTIKKGHEIAKAMMRKEEIEQTDEAMSHQAATTMKHVSDPTAGEKKAAKDIKPGIAGYRDRIAMLQSAKARGGLKEEEAEQIDEGGLAYDPLHPKNLANTGLGMSLKTKIKRRLGHDEYGDIRARHGGPRSLHYGKKPNLPEQIDVDQFADYDELIETKPFEYEVQENYNFGDYLKTAKQLVGEEEAINLANEAFNAKDTDLFLEAVGREDIEAKVKMHSAAGHKVSTPKYSTKGGEFHAEYVVTDKESGIRRKYIHHGSSRKVENMGAAGKRD